MAQEPQRAGFNALGQREFALQASPRGNPAALNVPTPGYATGLFTPNLTFGGASTGLTASLKYGFYTRTGNKLSFEFLLMLTAKGSSVGNAVIGLFPYEVWGVTGVAPIFWANMTTSLYAMFGAVADSSVALNEMALFGLAAAGTSIPAITDADFSNTSVLACSGSYFINAF